MTYRERYETNVNSALTAIGKSREFTDKDLFKANMYLMEAMELLEEAHNVLVEVSTIAFNRVVK